MGDVQQCTGDALQRTVVFTDGSSLKQGKKTAAGAGIFFGANDPSFVDGNQTNQRAELTAVRDALSRVKWTENVITFSDSRYAMNSVTIWYKRNVIKSWKSVQPISFPNWDLIEDTVKILNERRMKGGITEFYWVKGHSGNAGNEAADKLAGNGARYALPTPDRNRYGKPYGEERRSLSALWNPAPPGWRVIKLANGDEELVRINKQELMRKKKQEKKRVEKAQAARGNYKRTKNNSNANKAPRPKNAAERIAARKAMEDAIEEDPMAYPPPSEAYRSGMLQASDGGRIPPVVDMIRFGENEFTPKEIVVTHHEIGETEDAEDVEDAEDAEDMRDMEDMEDEEMEEVEEMEETEDMDVTE
ncbi:hypothetical protein J4E82_011241 [Alternaria postmessia]|uniref:uncharacterized protein n=1 Tax=Alternaria postmessia TaxID=1187938 RepID=UPI002224B0E8|nr:uncharacterized protein J4E82_011241 [Alternaria postmessia]KAI5365722.1 hypothetical protein J4E82_011241 [Alternaria postmessia]